MASENKKKRVGAFAVKCDGSAILSFVASSVTGKILPIRRIDVNKRAAVCGPLSDSEIVKVVSPRSDHIALHAE